MPDPEGFKAGSAWMDVKPNIDETEWHAKIAAALEGASVSSSPALSRGLSEGLHNAQTPIMDEAERLGKGIGTTIGDDASRAVAERLRDSRGRFISAGEDIGAGLGDGLSQGVDPGLDDVDTKIKDKSKKTGQDAGSGFAGGMSPLIMSAFAGVASAGPGLILAGTAAAVLAGGALITKGNADLTGSYKALGQQASTAIQAATAPLIPALQGSLNILDQGIPKVGSELKGVFAAAAPDAQDFTRGLLSLADNALPGIATGLRAIQPESHVIADDLGKLGTGVGDLFTGLATGAHGGAVGLDALITTAEHLLGDVGQIAGSLSNGLGPALHDISDVAIPVAGALTGVVKALPPGDIRIAADATAALFAAFKIATLTGVVAEGTTFVGFLKSAAAGEIALTGETGVLTTTLAGLGTAADAAAGPLGLVAIALAANTQGAGSTSLAYAGVKDAGLQLGTSVDALTGSLAQAASGNQDVQGQLDHTAQLMRQLKDSGAVASGAFGQLDTSLVNVYRSNPGAATKEYTDLTKQLGLSASDAAAKLPLYTQAVKGVGSATAQSAAITGDAIAVQSTFTTSLQTETGALGQNAQKKAEATLAALGLTDGESKLTTGLYNTLQAFDETTGAASAYGSVLSAEFGKYQSYSDAVAAFTISLKEQGKQLTAGKDAVVFTTDAGAKNEQVLSGMAKQNYQVAEALLTQTGSQQQANKALQAGVVQIDAVAKNAHFTKGQIDALNIALYGTKNIGDIKVPISADTAPARQEVAHLLNDINASYGTVQINVASNGAPGGKALGGWDDGGWVNAPAGAPVPGIVHGQEYVLSTDMLSGRQSVDARVLASLRAAMTGVGVGAGVSAARSGAGVGAAGAGGVETVPVAVNVYIDGKRLGGGINAGVRAEVQQFARHNALTGYAANYE